MRLVKGGKEQKAGGNGGEQEASPESLVIRQRPVYGVSLRLTNDISAEKNTEKLFNLMDAINEWILVPATFGLKNSVVMEI